MIDHLEAGFFMQNAALQKLSARREAARYTMLGGKGQAGVPRGAAEEIAGKRYAAQSYDSLD